MTSTLISCANVPAIAASDAGLPAPPVAKKIEYLVSSPNGERSDPYYWLRDDERKDADVIAYLEAENAYYDAVMAPLKAVQQKVFKEIVGRIKQDDSSVPVFDDGYWYYRRYEEGKQHPIYARRKGSMDAVEEILLDGNELAGKDAFFKIGNYEISPDNQILVWAEDRVGRRQYQIKAKNLVTGQNFFDGVGHAEASLAWTNDNRTFLYIEKHPETLLGYRVRAHALGTKQQDDRLVYEEKDVSFYMGVERSKSGNYIYIQLQSTLVSEVLFAASDDLTFAFKPVLPRAPDLEYQVEDLGDNFIIRNNWQAENFKISRAAISHSADIQRWKDVVPGRDDAFIENFDVFKDYLAINERSNGLLKIRVQPWSGGKPVYIASDEPAYTFDLIGSPSIDATTVRYSYTSMTTPYSTYEYNMATGEDVLLKQEAVLGGFDSENYVTEFIHATSRDGTRIPISLVYHKSTPKNGTAPLLQYGYGSYGIVIDPSFSVSQISLLDRGFVFAVAHMRGGEMMGRKWYEAGKLLNKINTFNDFIDVTEHLITQRYVDKRRVYAMGGSAGGLLMGAVANMRPDLYSAMVAHVPFVDVVTTMLDESIPLTTNEFDEWGNPKSQPYYDYMLSYSPYDNVTAQQYPAMLVTTGLWDSQVQYWEPAKWVAKLRATQTGKNVLIYHTNMEAGHGGKAGRFERYEEISRDYAFILGIDANTQ